MFEENNYRCIMVLEAVISMLKNLLRILTQQGGKSAVRTLSGLLINFINIKKVILIKSYIKSYITEINSCVNLLDSSSMERILKLLQLTRKNKGRIFVAGNGGSSSLANHFACDLGKNVTRDESSRFQIISLCDNMGSITAYANDEGYENVFSEQLKNYSINENDIIILISSSGNSPNIIKAAEYAKLRNSKLVGLSGFTGGKLKELSDYGIHIPKDMYEIVEDVHGIALHIMVSFFKNERLLYPFD